MCARTKVSTRDLVLREKMRLAKFILRLGKFIFSRSRMGKCKPQKIFSKPHFFWGGMTQINSWGRYNEVTRTLPLS